MSTPKKRIYNSKTREAQADQTKNRILTSSRELFKTEGFECVTIEKIASEAGVSVPTIYSLFKSKRGIFLALMKDVFPVDKFEELGETRNQEKCPRARLAIIAQIAREINDAEKAQMDIIRGASVLAPELKKLENEKEELRYEKQEETILRMVEEGSLIKELTVDEARAVLWAFTGRDMYRMFVIKQKWSSAKFEKWLARTLVKSLVDQDYESIS